MEAQQVFLEEWTEILGTTQPLPERAARITAAVEGQVVLVLPEAKATPEAPPGPKPPKSKQPVEGQPVSKGDVIVQLDDGVVRANRDKLRANLKKLTDQEKQAQVAVDLAQLEVNRLEKLKTGRVPIPVPESDIEKANLLLKDAKLKKEGVKTDLEAGKAELNAVEVQLDLYKLTAPINGRLGRLLVVPGQTLPPGTLVADVIDLSDQIDVLCFVPPHIAKRLEKGQPAHVGGLGPQQPGATSGPQGKVEFIADQAELDSGNFAVKVRFPNSQMKLRANTTLRLRVRSAPGRACLAVRESALLEDQDPPGIIVVEDYKKETIKVGPPGKEKEKEKETGKARKLRVKKVGIRDRVLHMVEILGVDDPENKWKGSLETAKFVYERGQGVRTDDKIKLEVEEEEGE
jgi:RND family efflux transporter MFP subunit